MKEAKRIGVTISCHCDFGDDENNAIRRVIELGKQAGCRIHIAHVSTKKAAETIRWEKQEIAAKAAADTGFVLSCEVMPHNLCLTEEDANKLGAKTWGRVNPPLRSEEDRQALIQALKDGTVDAIATDHAPHSAADKETGLPGFSGFETAFAALYPELVHSSAAIGLKQLSSLLSASPARVLGFENSQKHGRILPDYTADLVILDTEAIWLVEPEKFKSRGKNSPFTGRKLQGKILMTLHRGQVVFQST
jgi:dihydroorotase